MPEIRAKGNTLPCVENIYSPDPFLHWRSATYPPFGSFHYDPKSINEFREINGRDMNMDELLGLYTKNRLEINRVYSAPHPREDWSYVGNRLMLSRQEQALLARTIMLHICNEAYTNIREYMLINQPETNRDVIVAQGLIERGQYLQAEHAFPSTDSREIYFFKGGKWYGPYWSTWHTVDTATDATGAVVRTQRDKEVYVWVYDRYLNEVRGLQKEYVFHLPTEFLCPTIFPD